MAAQSASVLSSLSAGIPCSPLPEHPGRDDSVPHAPRFSVVLTHAETRCVLLFSIRSHPSLYPLLVDSLLSARTHPRSRASPHTHEATLSPVAPPLPGIVGAATVLFRRSADLSGTGMAARRNTKRQAGEVMTAERKGKG
jgi:hypothetical protein